MTELLTVDSLISLVTLALLEIVLGIDNVIFVSILMGRLKPEQKLLSRRIWMFLGITTRVLLLMALGWLVTNATRNYLALIFQAHIIHLTFAILFFLEAAYSCYTKR